MYFAHRSSTTLELGGFAELAFGACLDFFFFAFSPHFFFFFLSPRENKIDIVTLRLSVLENGNTSSFLLLPRKYRISSEV